MASDIENRVGIKVLHIAEVTGEKIIKKIINNLALKDAEGLILGCTEIPLLIKQEDVSIAIFDTTKIHAISSVEFALKKE